MAEKKSISPSESIHTMTSRVSPLSSQELTTPQSQEQCTQTQFKDKTYFVYFPNTEFSYDEWKSFGNIVKKPTQDGLYNYIIYKTTKGNYDILCSKHIFPNEIASKHMYLLFYAYNQNLTNVINAYMAGELEIADGTYTINFMSGTFTAQYRRKWMSKLSGEPHDAWSAILYDFFKHKFKTENIIIKKEQSSFLEHKIIPMVPMYYRMLERMGKGALFFNKEKECLLYKTMQNMDILLSSRSRIKLKRKGILQYFKQDDKGQYVLNNDKLIEDNLNLKGQTLEMISSIRKGGKRTKYNKQLNKKNKTRKIKY